MATRIAGILAIIAFAMCLVIGGFEADNSLGTTLWRALQAMVGTLVIAYVLGLMAERMLQDVASETKSGGIGEKEKKTSKEMAVDGR